MSAVATTASRVDALRSVRHISAPMVGQSDVAWRRIMRRHGADVVYTQMLESDRFATDLHYRRTHFITCDEERPLIVQFSANDPQVFAQAAAMVAPFCDGVELNLGCPQRAARSGNFGAYLLDTDQHQLVVDILATARSSQLGVPTCAKIRLLPTLDETIHFCTLLLPHIDVLTIHGRTRGFVEERRRGPADLQQVKQVFAALRKHMAARPPAEQRSVLLWTNGNVRCDGDVALQLASTGADGCMVGEAVLNDPTMFEQRASTHPELLTFAPDTLLDVREFDRKMAIAEEYIQQLRTPKYAYRSPFDLQPSGASTDASNAASASAAAPTSCVDDSSFRTPLVDWSSFHAHLYRLFNADCRARFLYHAQLVDEFLDAGSIGEVRTILQSVRDRLAAGRPFDVALQSEIDGQRSHRQGARAAEERRRASALTGEKVINSRERKRARWQQRNHEKRRKLEDGRPAAGVEEVLRAAAAATATASEPD